MTAPREHAELAAQQSVTDEPCGTAAGGRAEIINVPGYPLMVRAVDYNTLRAEKDRLTACLEKANASAEHFEREWYLRGDELDTLRTQLAEAQRELIAKESELDGLRASRIAYAKEFPLNEDGEPDVGNIHANIRSLKNQLAKAQRDAEVSKQINRACAELPEDYQITIELERDAGWVRLMKEDEDMDFDDPRERVASSISAAIDAAKGGTDGKG